METLCACGCGKPTPLAKRTRTGRGHVAGRPRPYIPRHVSRNPLMPPKLCACGCGLYTSISTRTRGEYVKGQPMKYIRGHVSGKYETDRSVAAEKERECRRRYAKEQKERLRIRVWDYLSVHPCVDCGESDPVVLDFDHRDPKEKYKTISQIKTYRLGIHILDAEIKKCDVRCANCHRRRHFNMPFRNILGSH